MRRLLAMLATLTLLACKGENAGRASARPGPAPAATTAPASAPEAAPVITIDGETVDIAYGGQELVGEPRDNGKRKYSVDGGEVYYEVKPGEDGGFKLRTAEGKLLWKVKLYPDKIKISNNEENQNPFELKARDGNRTKVFAPGDKELGNVRFDGAKIDVENAAGQTQYTIASTKPTAAYGVLLLEAIPPQQRAVLAAEILARGR